MIRACIFDLDDTLVSGAAVWRRAEEALYDHFGSPFDENLALKYRGLNADGVGAMIHASVASPDISATECGAFIRERLIRHSATESRELPGAGALLELCHRYVSVAIASGSPYDAIGNVIRKFQWGGFVDRYVSSEQVPRGKPDPDVFLEAARLLGVVPDECVVVEDSLHGAQAAAGAGMRCYFVPSPGLTGIERIEAERVCGDLIELAGVLDAVLAEEGKR